MHTAAWIAILVMAVGTLVRLRFCGDRRFALTPLDLIVLFVALVVPSLPDTLGLPDGGALGIAKLVVLFYAMEVLVSRLDLRVLWLRSSPRRCWSAWWRAPCCRSLAPHARLRMPLVT